MWGAAGEPKACILTPPLAGVAQRRLFMALGTPCAGCCWLREPPVRMWSASILDSSGNFQNFTLFSLWKTLKTFETRATWHPPRLALGCESSLLKTTSLALQTLLYHNLLIYSFFFYGGEMFSIINHAVPAFPEPFPWRQDPELVRLWHTVGRSSHGEREAGLSWASPKSEEHNGHICLD